MSGVKEIAEKAGVSIGTVDRVLHDRGRCSEATKLRVLMAAKELQYQPNLAARRLKQKKSIKIAVLMAREHQDQGFWRIPMSGLELARREFGPFGVEIDVLAFDRYLENDFLNQLELAYGNYHGVLMSPLLPETAKNWILKGIDIPTVCFDCSLGSDIPILFETLQPGIDGGRLAADIFLLSKLNKDIPILAIGYLSSNIHIQQRLEGFSEVLQEEGYLVERRMIPDELNLSDLKELIENEGWSLRDHEAIFVAKTGVHKYANLLPHKCKPLLIGYDLTKENIQSLQDGQISGLISQNSAQQCYDGLKVLVDYLLYGRKPLEVFRSMPIDLVTRHNVFAYLKYHHFGR